MEVELKTKSLHEDLSEPDTYYVKLYLKNNEK